MYTSGSTGTVYRQSCVYFCNHYLILLSLLGTPKGLVTSHQNLISAMVALTDVATIYENDVYMANLPLAHVLELVAGMRMC